MKETRIEGQQLLTLLKSLPQRIETLPKVRLIVVGDIGLDEYVHGDVRRPRRRGSEAARRGGDALRPEPRGVRRPREEGVSRRRGAREAEVTAR